MVCLMCYLWLLPAAFLALRGIRRWYIWERNDPWFWNCFGLGAPPELQWVNFVTKFGAFLVSHYPISRRQKLCRVLVKLGVGSKEMLELACAYPFETYDLLAEAPTVGKGARELGMKRLSEWFYRPNQISCKDSAYTHRMMRPIIFIPGLRCDPFYDAESAQRRGVLTWVRRLEEATATIREEFLSLSKKDPKAIRTYLVPEDMKTALHGWRTFFFVNPMGMHHQDNIKLCPKTWEVLNSIPGFIDSNMTMFSVLSPGSEIKSHCGLTNAALRVHLPILVPEPTKAVIRAGEKVRTWEEGKVLAFNDAYDHQVWTFGKLTRVVLFFDVWHPDLTKEDLAVFNTYWPKLREVLGSTADEYEKRSKVNAQKDNEDTDQWLKVDKEKDT